MRSACHATHHVGPFPWPWALTTWSASFTVRAVRGPARGLSMGRSEVAELRQIASGLRFPEGPIAMADGSVVLVEIQSGHLSRVSPDGTITRIAETGGGPNGAAIGPDGKVYVCNNGGFAWARARTGWPSRCPAAEDYIGGRIQRVDLRPARSRTSTPSATASPARPQRHRVRRSRRVLLHRSRQERARRRSTRGGSTTPSPTGRRSSRSSTGSTTPNGVGLSPDGKTLYAAETYMAACGHGRSTSPGKVTAPEHDPSARRHAALRLPGLPAPGLAGRGQRGQHLRRHARPGAASAWSAPDGRAAGVQSQYRYDVFVTNICFGGPDLQDGLHHARRATATSTPRSGTARA